MTNKEHPLDRAIRESQEFLPPHPLERELEQLDLEGKALALRAYEIGRDDAIEALQTRDFNWLEARLAEGDPSSATARAYDLAVGSVLNEFKARLK
jgi:hypothetical protein